MRSVYEGEIAVPKERLAALYSSPDNNAKWMDDLDRCEPISGDLGSVGSTYRFIPKPGGMAFVATVTVRNLPDEVGLILDSPGVRVSVNGKFVALSPTTTRFTSLEEFTFNGLFGRLFGFLATGAIRKAHRRHMEAFKRFAEQDHPSG
ncbi:MAG: SRPBCC family protein [Myxococcales bacterium]